MLYFKDNIIVPLIKTNVVLLYGTDSKDNNKNKKMIMCLWTGEANWKHRKSNPNLSERRWPSVVFKKLSLSERRKWMVSQGVELVSPVGNIQCQTI